MSDNFAKVIELYQPSEEDLKEKEDRPDPSSERDPYADLNLLPLAKLCPELGKVIPAKGSSPDGPQRCC